MTEAKCPECGKWSAVEWQLFSFWWAGSTGCPGCAALILVETECEFREREDYKP